MADANGGNLSNPTLSADGQVVAFVSTAERPGLAPDQRPAERLRPQPDDRRDDAGQRQHRGHRRRRRRHPNSTNVQGGSAPARSCCPPTAPRSRSSATPTTWWRTTTTTCPTCSSATSRGHDHARLVPRPDPAGGLHGHGPTYLGGISADGNSVAMNGGGPTWRRPAGPGSSTVRQQRRGQRPPDRHPVRLRPQHRLDQQLGRGRCPERRRLGDGVQDDTFSTSSGWSSNVYTAAVPGGTPVLASVNYDGDRARATPTRSARSSAATAARWSSPARRPTWSPISSAARAEYVRHRPVRAQPHDGRDQPGQHQRRGDGGRRRALGRLRLGRLGLGRRPQWRAATATASAPTAATSPSPASPTT